MYRYTYMNPLFSQTNVWNHLTTIYCVYKDPLLIDTVLITKQLKYLMLIWAIQSLSSCLCKSWLSNEGVWLKLQLHCNDNKHAVYWEMQFKLFYALLNRSLFCQRVRHVVRGQIVPHDLLHGLKERLATKLHTATTRLTILTHEVGCIFNTTTWKNKEKKAPQQQQQNILLKKARKIQQNTKLLW